MPDTKKIFFCYSDYEDDRTLYLRINKHFSSYVRSKLVSIIDKDELFKQNANSDYAFEQLKASDIAVPLLSVDFVTSEECMKILSTARLENKLIVPVLLRDVDIDDDEDIKILRSSILPSDGKSVLGHFAELKDDDEILKAIAKKIKSRAFKEFEGVKVATRSGLFYWIIALVALFMGACAAVVVYQYINPPSVWISVFVFLLFVCIALFTIRDILFPTSFKRA